MMVFGIVSSFGYAHFERQLNVKQEVLQKMEEELLSTNGSNLKI